MIKTRKMEGGIVLPVRVQPSSSKEGIMGVHAGHLKVAVNAPPDRGRANKAVIKVLAKWLKVKSANIYLIHGEKTKDKEVFLKNITEKDIHKLVGKES